MIPKQLLNLHWWQNRVKYNPFVQRVFLARNLSTRFPAMLNIETTSACNLDCSFCPRKLSNRKTGFIDEGLFRKIVDELAVHKGIGVLFLMKDGEPLMHPGIGELIAYAKGSNIERRHPDPERSRGGRIPSEPGGILQSLRSFRMTRRGRAAKRLEIYTNGILLDRAMGEKLIKSGLDALTVSIDATNAETFKKLKGRDEYQRVVDNVRRFAKRKKEMGSKRPLLAAKMVQVPENEGEVKKFKKLWTGVADNVIIQKAHTWEGSVTPRHSGKPRANSSEQSELGGSREAHPESGFWASQNDKRRYPCNLPWLAPAINWDGKVVPCCVNFRENELVMGDVSKQTLAEIYTRPKFEALRQAHLDQDFSEFPTCERCSYWTMLPNMGGWLRKLKS